MEPKGSLVSIPLWEPPPGLLLVDFSARVSPVPGLATFGGALLPSYSITTASVGSPATGGILVDTPLPGLPTQNGRAHGSTLAHGATILDFMNSWIPGQDFSGISNGNIARPTRTQTTQHIWPTITRISVEDSNLYNSGQKTKSPAYAHSRLLAGALSDLITQINVDSVAQSELQRYASLYGLTPSKFASARPAVVNTLRKLAKAEATVLSNIQDKEAHALVGGDFGRALRNRVVSENALHFELTEREIGDAFRVFAAGLPGLARNQMYGATPSNQIQGFQELMTNYSTIEQSTQQFQQSIYNAYTSEWSKIERDLARKQDSIATDFGPIQASNITDLRKKLKNFLR